MKEKEGKVTRGCVGKWIKWCLWFMIEKLVK